MKLIEAELEMVVSDTLCVPITVTVSWNTGRGTWKSDLGPGGLTVVGRCHNVWFLSRKRPGTMGIQMVIGLLGYGASTKAVIID